MLPISETIIRASLINASQRERKELTLPADFAETAWDKLDYLGWRDRKLQQVGYVFVEIDGETVGILLKQAEAGPRARAQCTWCEDVTLPNDVVFFSTKRTGQAGRNGNTIATLICARFECSANVRKLPPVAYLGFDVEAARQRRIDALGDHVRTFVSDVRDGS
jgi:hypothetical protein